MSDSHPADRERRLRHAFGGRLARLRAERGLSQETLARSLSTSQEVVSRYEHGKYLPRLAGLLELRRLFAVSLDYLLAGASLDQIADTRLARLALEADRLPLGHRNLAVHVFQALVEAAKREMHREARAGGEP